MHEEMSKKLVDRFWSKVDARGHDDCWEWKWCRDSRGYGKMHVGKHKAGGWARAHHISFYLDRGYWPPEGLCVMHMCDVPLCVNPGHLLLGTLSDNVQDAIAKGRMRGNVIPLERLEEVRTTLETGTCREAAAILGVSTSTVHQFAIKHGLRITHAGSGRILATHDAEVREMIQRQPVKAVAEHFGVVWPAVYQFMAKNGISRPCWSEEKRRRREGLCTAG